MFPIEMRVEDYPFLTLALNGVTAAEGLEWVRVDARGTDVKLHVQSFNNSYRNFILIWLPGGDGFVAKHRRRSRIVVDNRLGRPPGSQ